MDRYMVVSPHTAEGCRQALIDVMEAGYITHFDWGCKDGEHTGWAVLEAESAKQALLVVPSRHRDKARAIKLTKFSPEEAGKMH